MFSAALATLNTMSKGWGGGGKGEEELGGAIEYVSVGDSGWFCLKV